MRTTRWTKRTLIGLLSGVLTLGVAGVPVAAHAEIDAAQGDIDIFQNDPNLPAGQVNLARGKTALTSSAYEMSQEGWATSFVNDGKVGTGTLPMGWSTNPVGNTDTVTTPAWVSLDLLAPSSIGRIAMYPRMDGANDGVNFPVDYAFQVSATGINGSWTTVATRTGNTAVTAAQVVDFEPAEGRFVRVRVTKRAPGGADGALVQLGELAVYGTSLGTTVQLDKPALALLPGESDTLVPTINGLPGDATSLTWTSSDPQVAKVDANGVVTAVALGSATITASHPDADPITTPVKVIAKRTQTDEELLISVFWAPTLEYTNAEQYDSLANANIDFVQNVNGGGLDTKTTNMRMATLAAERGMTVGVADPRLANSPNLTDAHIKSIVAEYQNVPGVGGIYLKDEPYNANPYGRVHRAVKDQASWLYPHLNFLPMNAYADRATFESQVDDFSELAGNSEVDFLNYDRYPFGDAPNSLDYNGMFANMDAMRTVGLEDDAKTGLYIQSIGRVNADGSPAGFRRTNAAEIRYEVNASLAFGFKQISYFTWFTPTGRGEIFTDAIITADGKRTDLYEPVKQLNAEVKAWGPTLMKLEARDVFVHGPDAHGQPVAPDGFIAEFGDDDDVLMSRMVDRTTGRQYLMVVNNNFQASQQVDLHLLQGVKSVDKVSRDDGTLSPLTSRNGKFSLDLPKGDAVLLALPSKLKDPKVPVGANVASNANVTTASSEGAGGWYMDKLTDGNRFSTTLSQGWRPTEIDADRASTVTLDLRASRKVNRLDVYPAGGLFGYGQAYPTSMDIQASTDGTTWQTVSRVTPARPVIGQPAPSYRFDKVQARYLRLSVDGHAVVDGKPALELSEIEAFDDDGTLAAPASFNPDVDQTPWFEGKNLAANQPQAVSSSTEAPGLFSSAYVNDGQFGTSGSTVGWTSQVGRNTSATAGEWAAVHLGGPYLVEQVVVHPRDSAADHANAGLGFPTDYQVETSLDGITWQVVATRTGDVAISDAPRTVTLDTPTSARYLRVVGTKLKQARPAADGYLMQLGEVQVFGRPAAG